MHTTEVLSSKTTVQRHLPRSLCRDAAEGLTQHHIMSAPAWSPSVNKGQTPPFSKKWTDIVMVTCLDICILYLKVYHRGISVCPAGIWLKSRPELRILALTCRLKCFWHAFRLKVTSKASALFPANIGHYMGKGTSDCSSFTSRNCYHKHTCKAGWVMRYPSHSKSLNWLLQLQTQTHFCTCS